jgi:serine/threonine protein kinase
MPDKEKPPAADNLSHAGASATDSFPSSSLTPLLTIPEHDLVRCISRGSYGEVWLAKNITGVYRAIKIVYRRNFEHERPYEREFSGMKKFEPVSRTHDGLVDILQLGRNDRAGYFYYIMELADDSSSLRDWDWYIPHTLGEALSKRGRLSFDECLQIGISLTTALAHLHQQGLVHRDIKPSNIIFVGGTPKLADVGLVTGLADARSYNVASQSVAGGDPLYQGIIRSFCSKLYRRTNSPTRTGEPPQRREYAPAFVHRTSFGPPIIHREAQSKCATHRDSEKGGGELYA